MRPGFSDIAVDNIAATAIVAAMPTERLEIDALLPLPAATFHILMAVAEEDRHGYAILQDVDQRTRGGVN